MMMDNWNWPQWFMIGVLAFNLLATSILQGKPRTGTYDTGTAIIGAGLQVFVLYCGGFFG